MDRRTAGLWLKRALQHHEQAEAAAIAALSESAPAEETFAAIEASSKFTFEGLAFEVKRRRQLEWCPVPGCRYAKLRAACPHANTRFALTDPTSGRSVTDRGILWHLLADHPSAEFASPTATTLIEILSAANIPLP